MSTAPEIDQRRNPLSLDPLSPQRDLGFVVDWQLDPPRVAPKPAEPPVDEAKPTA